MYLDTFFFYTSGHNRDLHSFPTRRSSDLIIEVMGRDSGYIALHSGIATGAENILIPERKTDVEDVIKALTEKTGRKKLVNIIVVAEGDAFGANELSKIITERMRSEERRVGKECRYRRSRYQ